MEEEIGQGPKKVSVECEVSGTQRTGKPETLCGVVGTLGGDCRRPDPGRAVEEGPPCHGFWLWPPLHTRAGGSHGRF